MAPLAVGFGVLWNVMKDTGPAGLVGSLTQAPYLSIQVPSERISYNFFVNDFPNEFTACIINDLWMKFEYFYNYLIINSADLQPVV